MLKVSKAVKLSLQLFCLSTAFLLVPLTQAVTSKPIKIVVPIGFLKSLEGLLEEHPSFTDGRDYLLPVNKCIPISKIKEFNFGRPVLDFLIHCEVVRFNKLGDTIQVIQAPNNIRAIKMLSVGVADAFSMSEFPSVINQLKETNLSLSDPVLRQGEFEVGFFTAPNRPEVLAITSVYELMNLTSITATQWIRDDSELSKLTTRPHVLVSNHRKIPNMIAKKRADFTTNALNKKYVYNLDGEVVLTRIDGFKLSLPGTRVFVVNSKSKDYFDALQAYIRGHRNQTNSNEDGIFNAFKDIGWISPHYKDWILLNDYFENK
ncbi:hypothetical protein [Paraglaciecola marina]|uniref:hypothetical protein n=1 Tax=Paraglaciecola marina TaxID=2500157 RepID=UPI001060C3B3|nr:hypothetical protein [Paraglaciecola marina]